MLCGRLHRGHRPGRRACTAARWSAPARPRTIMTMRAIRSPGSISAGRRKIPVPETRRPGNGKSLTVKGAAQNNLKNIDVSIPAGDVHLRDRRVRVAAKSSLVNEILYKALAAELNRAQVHARQARRDRGARAARQGHRHRPVARSAAPRAPTPRPIPACSTISASSSPRRRTPRCAGTTRGRFSFNVQGRPLRGVRGGRHHQDRDALSAGHLCALRGLQGQAV